LNGGVSEITQSTVAADLIVVIPILTVCGLERIEK